MKQTSRDALRVGLGALLDELARHPIPQEQHWEYHRVPAGGWQGALVGKPSAFALFVKAEDLLGRLAAQLGPVLSADYPDHVSAVGTHMGFGALDARMILTQLAYEVLTRFGAFSACEEQIEELLDEAAGFFDRPNIRLRLSAPVLNMHGPREVREIQFPGGVVLRPITDDEFTRFYGGNPFFQGQSRLPHFPDFIFVREIEVEKVIGRQVELGDDPIWKPMQEILDRCILALATFKDAGAVGYDGVRVAPTELAFGPAFGLGHLWGNEHVPLGRYDITPEEAPHLEAYATLFDNIHPSIEMACQRLVDAARRTKPRDSIVDSAIGLESILLADVGERQRGENRFRFSINYASLFPAADRTDAFKTARDLYDLRSVRHATGKGKDRR